MMFASDTGGTFTDLLVEDESGRLAMYKTPTTPGDPIEGVLDALDAAATDQGLSRKGLLERGELFIHGTTHAINAIVTGTTARTVFLTTAGHPDILVFREGGRTEPFNFTVPYPSPYVPKALTFEIPERVMADGSIRRPLEEAAVLPVIEALRAKEVEAVAVCLLWSILNPTHEVRLGELLAEHLPGVPVTLSHRLNPSLREYRRATSACIDASLKPLMGAYMRDLGRRLAQAGFAGRVLALTSLGGVMDAVDVADAPIHLINSGPSMGPVAGRHFARIDSAAETAIVADTGGTTFDVSVVRRGHISRTRETWIGQPFRGHMTGLASIDVKSIGAGGGSIAWVDEAGMLHVGPQSAGAVPGPACYGSGGESPTVTDAVLVLGYVDPAFFLGGAVALHGARAEEALDRAVARPLGLSREDAAAAVLDLATENMVQAITEITVNQGIDPRDAVLVAGGGAAGLNAGAIGRRLGCARVVVPEVGAGLSAAGALMSELTAEYRRTFYAHIERFDFTGVNGVLAELEAACRTFIDGPGAGAVASEITYFAEARYPDQVWEIEVPLHAARFEDASGLAALEEDFHNLHQDLFAVADTSSKVEAVSWFAQVSCRLRTSELGRLAQSCAAETLARARPIYFPETGFAEARVLRFEGMIPGQEIEGPAIVESSFTTVVLEPGARCVRRPSRSLLLYPAL